MPYKICSQCQESNGVRTLICKKCGHNFISSKSNNLPKEVKQKRIKKFSPINNLDDISQGDIVKIKQGSGPYYLIDGEKRYISITGIVKVQKKESNGFWAVHYKLKQNRGSFFVYMGKTCRSPIDRNLIRKRHKLLRVNNLRRV